MAITLPHGKVSLDGLPPAMSKAVMLLNENIMALAKAIGGAYTSSAAMNTTALNGNENKQIDAYSKEETDILLGQKQNMLTSGEGITITPATDGDDIAQTTISCERTSKNDYGVMKVGYGLSVSEGVVSVDTNGSDGGEVTLPVAERNILGGVMIGDNITINEQGKISITGSNVTSALGYTPPESDTTYDEATIATSGLMSADDKAKLDGIDSGAKVITIDTTLSSTSENPVQNKVINAKFAQKVDAVIGKGLSTNDFTTEQKNKLDGLNNYTLPEATKEAIGGVKVGEGINVNNGEISTSAETLSVYTKADVDALIGQLLADDSGEVVAYSSGEGIEIVENSGVNSIKAKRATANNYGSVKIGNNISVNDGVISVSSDNVTNALGFTPLQNHIAVDAELNTTSTNPIQNKAIASALDNKVDKETGKCLSEENFTFSEKNKLSNIADGANNYSHPTGNGSNHIPSGGSEGKILKWKQAGEAKWEDENSYPVATVNDDGLMSSADKTKLAGIDANANNYTHPTSPGNSHIPSGGAENQILRYDSNGKAKWDDEKAYAIATTTSDGLMSSSDKTKLDGLGGSSNPPLPQFNIQYVSENTYGINETTAQHDGILIINISCSEKANSSKQIENWPSMQRVNVYVNSSMVFGFKPSNSVSGSTVYVCAIKAGDTFSATKPYTGSHIAYLSCTLIYLTSNEA